MVSHRAISADDYGPAVSVTTWVLLVSTIVVACIKIAIKLFTIRVFKTHDGLLVAATASFTYTETLLMLR